MAKTAWTMLLVVVAALAALHGATAITQNVTAYGCKGYSFTVALNAYNFTSYMGNYSTAGIPGCDDTYIKVTKLYVKGACVSSRNNNFGISSALSDLNCGNKTDDYSDTTCYDVFKNGPPVDIVYGARIGEAMDSEEVCWPTQQAYIFVYNGCSQPVSVEIVGQITPYSGSCDTITVAGNKVGVSKGTLAAAIVGSIFGVLILAALIGTLIWCCCCQIRG